MGAMGGTCLIGRTRVVVGTSLMAGPGTVGSR
jgi:hypothetical protein